MKRLKQIEVAIISFQDIGSSLVFYGMQDISDYERGFPMPFVQNVYWRDGKSPQGYGPFHNIQDAMSHHVAIVKAEKAENNVVTAIPKPKNIKNKAKPDLSNIILVDFKAKKIIK